MTTTTAARAQRQWVAISGFLILMLGLALWLRARNAEPPPAPAAAKAPLVSTLNVDGRTLRSDTFAFQLDVPEPWVFLPVRRQPGLDVAVRDPASGTVLIGYGISANPKETVDATLELMVEQRRQQFSTVDDVVWGNRRAGKLELRSVAFTVPAAGAPSRTELLLAKRGEYLVGFNCSGPAPTFAASEKLCLGLIERIEPLRPLP